MSAADRPASAPAASDVAAACREAGLVRLVGTADGDALAAVGVLARALRAADVPFQASVAPVPDPGETDADLTVTVGTDSGDLSFTAVTTSAPAYAAARELAGADADPVLALAGVVASGAVPGETGVGLLEAAGLDRRPGLGIPVTDTADGLAHSTLVHLPTSGDVDATRTALTDAVGPLEDPDEKTHRRLASFLALTAVRGTPARAADVVERALRPYVGEACPFATLAGLADVLDAVARERPGTGVALALGHDAHEAALSAWREHGALAHETLAAADTGRYDGLFVVRAGDETPLGTVARLARDFRSPEPAVLVVDETRGAAALAGAPGVSESLDRACSALGPDGAVVGRGGLAHARFDADAVSTTDLVTAVREAV
jgi:hypothetical protein